MSGVAPLVDMRSCGSEPSLRATNGHFPNKRRRPQFSFFFVLFDEAAKLCDRRRFVFIGGNNPDVSAILVHEID